WPCLDSLDGLKNGGINIARTTGTFNRETSRMLQFTERGIYCPQADLYIDPWLPVKTAVITHGHSDHARRGSSHYVCQQDSVGILKLRLGADISVQGLSYNESISSNGV